MRDETIIKMLEDACTGLQDVNFPARTPNLLPVYNALLAAARKNHPEDPFLSVLGTIDGNGESGPEEMRILFGQLRILLESFQER